MTKEEILQTLPEPLTPFEVVVYNYIAGEEVYTEPDVLGRKVEFIKALLEAQNALLEAQNAS